MDDYAPRLVDGLIAELFVELPALFLVGPRAAGKTTTARRYASTVIRLDEEADAVAFRADPDAALRALREPVLLDEWQAVPGVLGAVKRTVDTQSGAGRFLVTGSVRGNYDGRLWPGTGRVTRIAMHGMTVREQIGAVSGPLFVDRVLDGDTLRPPADTPDLRGYVELLARSGFPEPALNLGEQARRQWLLSYVEQLVTSDAEQVDRIRNPTALRRYLEAYALNTAGAVEHKAVFDAAGIDRKTAVAYETLLTNLFVVEALPAWTSNRFKRLTLAAKRHVVDAGLAAAILGLDASTIMRSGDILGRLIETFVVSQLRAEVEIADNRPRLYHLRQREGRLEVDIVAEVGIGRIIAMEVKATAAPTARDARHLVTLREQLGEDFIAGIVFHTGPRTFQMGERITAVPISALWAG